MATRRKRLTPRQLDAAIATANERFLAALVKAIEGGAPAEDVRQLLDEFKAYQLAHQRLRGGGDRPH